MAITADYFADLTVTYNSTYANNGLTTGAPWGGAAGFVRACAALAAGERVALRAGTEKTSPLWKIPVAATGDIAVGDELEDTTHASTARVAVVVENDYVLVEDIADTDTMEDGDTVTTDGLVTQTTIDAAPTQPGVQVRTAFAADGDTTDGYIEVIGVNASWENDGTFALLDGDSEAVTNGLYPDAIDYWRFENLHVTNNSGDGIGSNATSNRLQFRNVKSSDNGNHGFKCFPFNYMVCTDCEARDNDGRGFDEVRPGAKLVRPVATGNGGRGIGVLGSAAIIDPLIVGNGGSEGIKLETSECYIRGGSIDGNSGDGIKTTSTGNLVEGVRITHNGGLGIDSANAAASILATRCVLYGNALGSLGTGVMDDGTCYGPVGDATIVTEANQVVTTHGYKTHTLIITIANVYSGTPSSAQIGDFIDGQDENSVNFDGTLLSVPTGDGAGSKFEIEVTAGWITHAVVTINIEAGGEGGASRALVDGQWAVQLDDTNGNATDYSTAIDADIRREEIDLGNGSTWITAGLTPDDPSQPAVGKVIEGTSYRDETRDGTYHEATEAEVEALVTFGANEELTGELEGGGGVPVGPFSEAWR